MVKIIIVVWVLIFLLSFNQLCNADTKNEKKDLILTIEFLSDPPYEDNWWPWSDDHFIVQASICNQTDSSIMIDFFGPCNDCNPKFYLEDASSGKEAIRTSEVDILYYFQSNYELESDTCYVDTFDISEWIQYDMNENTKYRFWIEYFPRLSHPNKNSSGSNLFWQGKLVSDTLEFIHK